jgi:hypothetical protein
LQKVKDQDITNRTTNINLDFVVQWCGGSFFE